MRLQEIIRRATEIGKQTGFITFDQLNELCPKELEPEDIEALLAALRDQGIQLTDGSKASNPSCSFCGKTQPEVLQLIAGAQESYATNVSNCACRLSRSSIRNGCRNIENL